MLLVITYLLCFTSSPGDQIRGAYVIDPYRARAKLSLITIYYSRYDYFFVFFGFGNKRIINSYRFSVTLQYNAAVIVEEHYNTSAAYISVYRRV